ncbi:hypothetical protein ACFYOD_35490 [Streptomyces sp. NPDC006703]|uniref:hypothetical protein n=1 Tax=Streptomyces sp. NPDC006703 TaxID=3364759 RepID=UPI0036737A3D
MCEQVLGIQPATEDEKPKPRHTQADKLALNYQAAKQFYGRSPASVVLKDARVRITERSSPVKGTVFAPGAYGCGGTLQIRTFTADLDTSRVSPVESTPNFPYKTSEGDPEVFQIFSSTKHCLCSWYLEIDWESGNNAGTVTVDDHGRPYRLTPLDPAATVHRLDENRHWTTGPHVPSPSTT